MCEQIATGQGNNFSNKGIIFRLEDGDKVMEIGNQNIIEVGADQTLFQLSTHLQSATITCCTFNVKSAQIAASATAVR
ncbi:hypothetical protein Y032_0222g2597 [Ancylostoma ceylanicum]|uniref:Uncharacterized protein n=1 Tax=Ancylostoma ceylanicum TaxID=53326 RepID=A0A016SHV2_9BILA|nr:hypothetical protein Y032_0222g2597 [Ancylostoma ceylanicum]